MSKRESNEPDMPGYILPEDSQLRLAKLGDHIRLLSRLAQPRTWDERREGAPEARMGELAICLELLADQVDLVLEEVSRPSRRDAAADAPGLAAETTSMRRAACNAGEGFAFGVTVHQIDALDHLIQSLLAHGDVLAAGHVVELAGGMLPCLGQMMYDEARAVRDILNRIEAQRLGPARGPRTGVREERAVYGAGLRPGSPPPASPSLDQTRSSGRLRLH